jgi:hypothetical protein
MSQYFLSGGGGGAGGDVVGPASSTDNALVRFDGTTGKLIQNGVAIETDLGSINSQDGTAGLPTYGFLSTAGVGMYLTGGGALGLANGSIGYVLLDNAGLLTALGSLTVNNDTKMNGAQIVTSVSSAVDYVVLTNNFQIVITDTSVARTVTLPASPTTYQQFRIKDGSFAAGTNNITVQVSGGVKTIDGALTAVININGGYLTVMYDGSNYLIVG